MPIRVTTLRGNRKIPFSAYVRVAGKYILYCRQGDSFEEMRLERLKGKKLKLMYVQPQDKPAYELYLEQNITNAYDLTSQLPMPVRTEVIQGFQQAALENYWEHPDDEVLYKHLHSSIQKFNEFNANNPDFMPALLSIPNSDHSISHHCLNVAALATSLARELGFSDATRLHQISLGALLHDIEHFLEETDVEKPLSKLTPEELATYKNHPINGAKRLQAAPFVDQIILAIIKQHEECTDGSGYPDKLLEKQMDPLTPIVGLANAYDRLISFEGKSHKEAIKPLTIEQLGKYPLSHIQALTKILKEAKLTD